MSFCCVIRSLSFPFWPLLAGKNDEESKYLLRNESEHSFHTSYYIIGNGRKFMIIVILYRAVNVFIESQNGKVALALSSIPPFILLMGKPIIFQRVIRFLDATRLISQAEPSRNIVRTICLESTILMRLCMLLANLFFGPFSNMGPVSCFLSQLRKNMSNISGVIYRRKYRFSLINYPVGLA